MKETYKDGVILKNKEIFPSIFLMSLDIKTEAKPGQFFMLRTGDTLDPLLPRPLSITSTRNGCTAFLYEIKGKGTNLISKLNVGEKIKVFGPLGNGFDIPRKGKIAIVSGGIGIAPMLSLVEELGKLSETDLYAGFRTGSYLIDYLSPLVRSVNIATEDGSVGEKGLVTDIFNPKGYDMVYTCGPVPMMEAVYQKSKEIVPVQISMERRMACGFGACLGCSIKTSKGMRRVCKEGPVFLGEEVFYG